MYNILIIDDEAIHRRGLQNMILKERENFSVDTANNGVMALEMMKEKHYDIALTDIRMPVMDGIEFMKRLMSEYEETEIIVISGYAEFEYAQQAIKLGVCDYILKPINKNKLFDAIKKAENRLKDMQINKEKMDKTLPFYMKSLLSMVISGNKIDTIHQVELEKVIPSSTKGGIFIIRTFGQEKEKKSNFTESISFEVYNALKEFGKTLLIKNDEEEQRDFIFIFICSDDKYFNVSEQCTNLVFKINTLEIKLNCKLQLGFGAFVDDILGKGKEAYNTALITRTFMFYEDSKKVSFYEEQNQYINDIFIYDTIVFDKLNKSVKAGDINSFTKELDIFFEGIIKKGYFNDTLVKNEIIKLSNTCFNVGIAYFAENEYREIWHKYVSDIKNTSFFCEIKKVFLDFAKVIIGKVSSNLDKTDIKVQNILSYIDENLHKDISQEEIAKYIGFNKAYFSQFFRISTGINFSKYITTKRIERAMELLSSGNDKIYVIATKVGYADSSYFNNVFKRMTGFSPEEYRQNNQRR